MSDKKTLQEWRDDIEKEVDYIDLKPYSHNIISICLQAIARYFGVDDANQALEDFGLDEKGWQVVENGSIVNRLENRGF